MHFAHFRLQVTLTTRVHWSSATAVFSRASDCRECVCALCAFCSLTTDALDRPPTHICPTNISFGAIASPSQVLTGLGVATMAVDRHCLDALGDVSCLACDRPALEGWPSQAHEAGQHGTAGCMSISDQRRAGSARSRCETIGTPRDISEIPFTPGPGTNTVAERSARRCTLETYAKSSTRSTPGRGTSVRTHFPLHYPENS